MWLSPLPSNSEWATLMSSRHRRTMQLAYPKLKDAGLEWATFLVMRRTFASLSKAIGIGAHTRSAQMGNTVDVNENEYAVSSFAEKLAAVLKLESSMVN